MNTKRNSRDFIVRTAMTLLVMLLTSATAWAEKYIDADGIEKTQDGVIVLSSGSASTLSTGWYVIDNDIEEPITFNGNVNLIIQDDKNVTITGADGITVTGSLTIYGQNKGTGSLTIDTKGNGSTSGDGIYVKNGEITLNGGIITITADRYGITTYDNITINGGIITVTATGENSIDASGNITINGGNVNANGKYYGIAAEGTVTLNGGIVTANGTGNIDPRAGISANKGANTIYLGGAIVIASSYSGTVTVKDGVTYKKYDLTTIDVSTIGGVTIFPTTCFGIASGNNGSEEKPYTITSPEELQLLACLVNEENKFTSKYIQLNNDLDMYGIDFSPIGFKTGTKFCGDFDGGGYIIRNLHINIDNTSIGLFGLVDGSGAIVQNTTISNANITGQEDVGGIVGSLVNGSIKNCFVINSTITSTATADYHCGAIVGDCGNNSILASNFYSGCTINVSGTSYKTNAGCGSSSKTSDVAANDGAIGVTNATIISEMTSKDSWPSFAKDDELFFYREFTGGTASTICMPFDYKPNASDGTFYTFAGITTTINDTKTEYVATMQEANKAPSSLSDPLSANTPYLFMPAGTDTKLILFHGPAAASKGDTNAGNTTKDYWEFIGTYTGEQWTEAPKGIYGFSAQAVKEQSISQGQFVKVGEYVKIRSLRAYLQYTGSNFPNTRGTLSEDELPDRILVRLVDSDGDITGIGHLDMKTGEITFDNGWYTLEGVRLSGKPAKHGIYVNNGRKHMIK